MKTIRSISRWICAVPLLASASTSFGQIDAVHEARPRAARYAEDHEPTRSYLIEKVTPAFEDSGSAHMQECIDRPGMALEPSAILADISEDARYVNISYAPPVPITACFASLMRSFEVPLPSGLDTPVPVRYMMWFKP